VAGRRARIERAAALHREVTAVVAGAQQALDAYAPEAAPVRQYAEQHELAARLRAAATELVPDWLGAPLDAFPSSSPLPAPGAGTAGTELPRYVRLGQAQPLDDARFPVVVPLLGAGHLAINADARDPRASGLLSSLLLRLVAAMPAGALRIGPVDATRTTFTPFRALTAAGLMAAPAYDSSGLRGLLTEAEEWVREPGRHTMLLVIASLPELTEGVDLARIAALAWAGPASRLHLIVAGWPPPPLTAATTEPPLAYTTQVTLRNPYALIGDPPDGSFGSSQGLNSPVYLDSCPPVESIHQVCAQIAAEVGRTQVARAGATENRPRKNMIGTALPDLLPDRLWRDDASQGLSVTVGYAGEAPLTLQLSELTPHWLVGGRSSTGRSSFLTNLLYGLSTRYGPDEVMLYLLDIPQFASVPADGLWIPHIRAAGIRPDREYGLAVLQTLHAEMVTRNAMNQHHPRIVCLIEDFDRLVRGTDRTARDALVLLDSLARKGRSHGIHLILSTASLRGLESLYAKRDSLLGQFPVRVALAGGTDVLDPLNQAADTLAPGQAVVNTAGGLGGPLGASRAHERVVEFPDPLAEPGILATLRHRLWQARPPDAKPPPVFDGHARQHLPTTLPSTPQPTAYLGRIIDVLLSLAAFALGPAAGRHLAVLGPSESGADILDSAARSLAAQHSPGAVDFVVASFAAARSSAARLLDQSLRAMNHQSRLVDAAEFKEIVRDPAVTRTYILGFGLDAAPNAGLASLIAEGPARHVHLLGWWRGLRRFREESGDVVTGLVVLNLPAADAALLVGDAELDWQPRPNRALLHDRATGRTDVIVPFVQSGRSR
jgi:DNA segregation ATPase FtsK/SpoIIIE, S-DNA-T family